MAAYGTQMFSGYLAAMNPRAGAMKGAPAFYRNLEAMLDVRRARHDLLTAKPRWDETVGDYTSSDFLSLNRSGRVRELFLAELAAHPQFVLSASGSRVQFGNYEYLCETEEEIARIFKAETAIITHSGFMANVAVLPAIAMPGDAFVYDEAVHASSHDGMALSKAEHKISFAHNDVDALREVLEKLSKENQGFVTGANSIIILVESVYSMDGDICPLQEMVALTKEMFPMGNAQFVIDEAQGIGIIGPNGCGLVALLGLEKDIAIRIHMASKAAGSTGGIVLCNQTIRSVMISHARYMIYAGAPSFPMVAGIRVGIRELTSGACQEAQDYVQRAVRHFFNQVTSHPSWDAVNDEGILRIPVAEDHESRPFVSHIVPLRTRVGDEKHLSRHLLLIANANAYAISFPIVPKNKTRVRLVFHAHNSLAEVEKLAGHVMDWAEEMLRIDEEGDDEVLPKATRMYQALEVAA